MSRNLKRAAIEHRRMLVAVLLLSAKSYSQIRGALAGLDDPIVVSHGTIVNDVGQIRKEWRDARLATYSDHIDQQVALLDQMQGRLVPSALAAKPNLWAIDRILAIMDRKAKLLGLDQPSKVEVSMKIEMVVRALEETLTELGLDAQIVRPVLGRRLRELEAAPS